MSLARRIGVPAFFYTGPMVRPSAYSGLHPPPLPYESEFARFSSVFGGGLPSPAYTVASAGEMENGSEAPLVQPLKGLAAPLGEAAVTGMEPFGTEPTVSEREACGCEASYYAVQNAHVVVIVLDDASGGDVEARQRQWLEEQLQRAGSVGKPAVVVANADLTQELAPGRHDEAAELLFSALVGENPDGQDAGHYVASGYFYDAKEENVREQLAFHARTLPVFGSGTLGYELQSSELSSEFHGAKGLMLGQVEWGRRTAAEAAVNRAPVEVRLIPVIGELAMEAKDGTLLPRSRPALFGGLARRQRAGCRSPQNESVCAESQYVPIPSICVGTRCPEAVLPEYEFALLPARHRRLREAQHRLKQPALGAPEQQGRTGQGRSRNGGGSGGGDLGALLCLQRGRNDGLDPGGWPLLHAARAGPGRERAPAVRHGAAERTAGKPVDHARPSAVARGPAHAGRGVPRRSRRRCCCRCRLRRLRSCRPLRGRTRPR